MTDPSPLNLPVSLSDAAKELAGAWFSFGPKATINISPPHANLRANKAALDELVEAGLVTHEHEAERDIHTFKGTADIVPIAKESLRAYLSKLGLLSSGQDGDA